MKTYQHPPITNLAMPQQIYLILIGYAQRRQLVTYGELCAMLGYEPRAAQMIGSAFLSRIKAYCETHNLPQLNLLVVNESDGKPGNGAAVDVEDLAKMQSDVFRYPWFRLRAPSTNQLKEKSCGVRS